MIITPHAPVSTNANPAMLRPATTVSRVNGEIQHTTRRSDSTVKTCPPNNTLVTAMCVVRNAMLTTRSCPGLIKPMVAISFSPSGQPIPLR